MIVPAIIGAGAILVCNTVLPALAGPYILPEVKAARYAVEIWASHALVFFVMGYVGATQGGPRAGAVATGLAALTGGAAALFYMQSGLLAQGLVALVGMIGMAVPAGLLGALAGQARPRTAAWPVLGLVVLALLALGVAFLRTGVVSGTVTRPVNQITFGMMTGQKDEPVPGVPVVLTKLDGKTRLYETKANATGNYVFNGPAPGEYMLFVHDTEPKRGSGQWVSTRVRARAHLSGLGVGAGDISLPAYRDEQESPFLD